MLAGLFQSWSSGGRFGLRRGFWRAEGLARDAGLRGRGGFVGGNSSREMRRRERPRKMEMVRYLRNSRVKNIGMGGMVMIRA